MTPTLGRRLGAVERRMGIGLGPFANFSDADLLAALEWIGAALGEVASESFDHGDDEEAKLKAFYERPDVAFTPDLEEGWRWPNQRARALWHERQYSNNRARSAATTEKLHHQIAAALATMRRMS